MQLYNIYTQLHLQNSKANSTYITVKCVYSLFHCSRVSDQTILQPLCWGHLFCFVLYCSCYDSVCISVLFHTNTYHISVNTVRCTMLSILVSLVYNKSIVLRCLFIMYLLYTYIRTQMYSTQSCAARLFHVYHFVIAQGAPKKFFDALCNHEVIHIKQSGRARLDVKYGLQFNIDMM